MRSPASRRGGGAGVALLCAWVAVAAPALGAVEVVVREGVVYREVGGESLALDLALPADDSSPRPAVLCLHGGGWRAGSRAAYGGLIRELAARGFVAASASYRFAPAHPWPAQIDDARAALAWLRGKASELAIDRARIGVTGASAGGHLALLLGAGADGSKGERRLVEAVVNVFGPTDLTRDVFTPDVETMIRDLAGGARAERPEIYRALSPIAWVGPSDAPVLTFHGTTDALVPVDQARELHAALEKARVPGALDILDGRGHGWGGEDLARTNARSIEFFERYLRGSDLPLVFSEGFDDAASRERWKPLDAAQWKWVREGEESWLALVTEKSSASPKVRSPFNIAILEAPVVEDFVLDVDLQYTSRDYGHSDLCIVFGHQDPEHFYYVHLGKQADAHANSIFVVDGAPRVSIAKTRTDGTDWDALWHRARVRRVAASGLIEVYFDDMETPVMTAEDRRFASGRVGIGSFDDKGNFDNVRLRGNTRS